ncbi:hypothetical protein [Thermopirellula anaerolimosa]
MDHQRQRDWTGAPIGGTTLSGTETESSDDTWLYSLTFSEAKPQGTSSTAWQFTSVSGEGGGLFYADHTIEGSGNYQFDVRQGLATLQGVKNYGESLIETNRYTIGFHITPNGRIAFDLSGHAAQWLVKDFDYNGETGATSYAGGNGTMSLEESGCVHADQVRAVDWQYDGSDYDADAETTKATRGSHVHDYQDDYSYSGCGYSYSSHASWPENSSWQNVLTKRHSFSDSAWPTLWTGRFTSYEQSGSGCGAGSKATSYWSSGCGCGGGSSQSDQYDWTGCWSESYDSVPDEYSLSGGIDNHVTGTASGCGCGSSYDQWVDYIGFRWPTYTSPYAFDYVYPTQTGKLNGGLGEGCGCGCGGLYGFETYVPIGRTSDTSANSTIGRLPSGGLISPSPLAAAHDLGPQLAPFATLPEAPAAAQVVGLTSYREPNAIHGNGSPELPQNVVFAEWGAWRDRDRLNQALEDAIEELANLTTPPPGGPRPDKTEMPGVVVLDLYDTDQSGDQSVTVSVPSGAGSGHTLRAPAGSDALVEASLEGGSLTISVPQGSTSAGLTAVTVVGKDADGLPVAWTVLVHVVAVEGYTVEEQAWGETTWDAPEDSGDDWALLWQCNDYRWLPQTTFDGLVTAADWSFASVTVDSSRERWAYGTPSSTGVVPISPVVTFGGQNIYFETLNTAAVGLHRQTTLDEAGNPQVVYNADQPRVAVTYVSLVEWDPVSWSREIEVTDYGTSTGVAKLTTGEDGYLVYPDYAQHPVVPQPIDHNTVRVKVELGAPVPEGMVGTVHLVWFDPDNTVANVPSAPPANTGHGIRDNAASLVAAGGGLPGFSLDFTTEGPSPNSHWMKKAYLAIEDARYGDNFIVAVHPHSGIAETFEFRDDRSGNLVLMHPNNTGLWTPLPDDNDPNDDPADGVQDHRTSVLTIIPSVDIDTDSDNTGVIDRSDGEEEIENQADRPGKLLVVNSDDDNENGIQDYVENADYNYPDGSAWVPFTDDELFKVVLDYGFEDLCGMDGLVFELKVTVGRGLNYWADAEKTPITADPVFAPDEVMTIVEAGHEKVIYRWFVTNGLLFCPDTIYVEGIPEIPLVDSMIWTVAKPNVPQDPNSDPAYTAIDTDTVRCSTFGMVLTPYTPSTRHIAPMPIPMQKWKENGVGIRRNGDYDNGGGARDWFISDTVPGENDLIRIDVDIYPASGVTYFVKCNSPDVRFWSSPTKGGSPLDTTGDGLVLTSDQSLWVEWTSYSDTAATLIAEVWLDDATTEEYRALTEYLTLRPFESVTAAFVGEHETAGDPAESPGLNDLVIKLLLDGYDVHVWDDGHDWWQADEADEWGRGPAHDEIVHAVNHRGVTQVALLGYSHGGGTVYHVAWRLDNNYGASDGSTIVEPYELVFASYLDAVRNNRYSDVTPETRRPPGASFFLNQYQTNSWLRGGPVENLQPGDLEYDRSALGVEHSGDLSIDLHPLVIQTISNGFEARVAR